MTTATIAPKRPSLSTPAIIWIGLALVFVVIGLVSAFFILRDGLVHTNLTDSIPWGLWITIDLSAIALGAGAFTLSAVVYIFNVNHFRPIVRLAILVGLVGYTTALLTLIMDIGRPDRFWHPWVYWNVHSVLWEITWCITIYLTIMLIEFAPVIADLSFFDRWPSIRVIANQLHRIAPVMAVLGLGISLLHQSSLGATYGILKARPIWFKPSMPIMFIISAIAVGPAVTMALAWIVEWISEGRKKLPHDILYSIARFSGLALLVYAYIKFWDLAAVAYYGSTPGSETAFDILNRYTPYGFGFWVIEVLLGIIIPIFLFLLPRTRRNPLALVGGSLLAALGLVFNRWNVTVSGLTVPLTYALGTSFQVPPSDYSPALVEWGIALGILGYIMLILTVAIYFLPIFEYEEDSTHH